MIIESSSKYNYQIQKHDSNKLSIFLYLSELSNLDLVLNRFGEAARLTNTHSCMP
jgi:hypothetical protein